MLIILKKIHIKINLNFEFGCFATCVTLETIPIQIFTNILSQLLLFKLYCCYPPPPNPPNAVRKVCSFDVSHRCSVSLPFRSVSLSLLCLSRKQLNSYNWSFFHGSATCQYTSAFSHNYNLSFRHLPYLKHYELPQNYLPPVSPGPYIRNEF